MRATIRYGVLPPVPPGPRQFGYRMSPIGTFEPSTDVRSTAAFGGDPELGRMIAYRLQERAFGGLDRESLGAELVRPADVSPKWLLAGEG